MFDRNFMRVGTAIFLICGVFLLGISGCCGDYDGDGYNGYHELFCPWNPDCDDSDPSVNAGAAEGPYGDATCSDGLDNDCDYVVDMEEPDCVCRDEDGDGYGDPAHPLCAHPELDCDDDNRYVYPTAFEFCNDGIDNQCPGDTGYGVIDEDCEASIPAGCFDMGDHFGEGDGDEVPVHNVCISAFEMDMHEVTNAEYAQCVDAGVCYPPYQTGSYFRATYYGDPAYDDFPVIYTDWYWAKACCAWAGKRLPTEAEWEYAARGGLAGKEYPWGDTISASAANYYLSSDLWDNDTSPVGHYAANGYGLYDMAGNVWELVNDWYQSDYYTVSPPNDPTGPASGVHAVHRGGSYNDSTFHLRVANRSPSVVGSARGFRCAR